jgi:hypothetical protein
MRSVTHYVHYIVDRDDIDATAFDAGGRRHAAAIAIDVESA